MHGLTPEAQEHLKDLVSQFVATYMGDLNTSPLHEGDAEYIGDAFYGILMDEFVNPGTESGSL